MKEGSNREFFDTYRSVRKKMPPPEKVIKPKTEFKRERFDWRAAVDGFDEDDYSIKGGNNE